MGVEPTGASAATSPGPISLAFVVVVGVAAGWMISRFLAGARTREEFLTPPRIVDVLARRLADRFGDRLLGDSEDDDLDRIVEQAVVTTGALIAGWIVAVLLARDSVGVILSTLALIVLGSLQVGEALVAHGARPSN
ncbi:hypothetical protein [Halarchaeum salinum]|uniref:Uncharacterized protein n=1 Tax=Halarchaeum salinum TaxID=489912 RepID=A0AAV3S9H3_9EURY